MSSFIKDYFDHLKKSDENTKHKSALFLSLIGTLIILSILFLILKDKIFTFNNQDAQDNNVVAQNLEDSSNTKNDVVSPFTSFTNFIKDSGEQLSQIKADVSSTFSSSSNKN